MAGWILGRDAELALLRRAAAGIGPQALIVLGEPGVGKTALLDAVAAGTGAGTAAGTGAGTGDGAGAARGRVLRVRGSQSEQDLAFAGLHQLLGPILGETDRLPQRQRAALNDVLGFGGEHPVPRMLLNLAVLNLLSDVADQGRVLLLADDAQWIDHASLEVLAFAARRLDGEPILFLAAARGQDVPPSLEREFTHVALAPLSAGDAEELLDRQPNPPRGTVRAQVLEQAAGNPLALTELPKTLSTTTVLSAGTLPLTARLEAVFAGQLAALPQRTRELLLLAAASDSALLTQDPDAWLPAERAGLIEVDAGRLTFRHPLVRSAAYQAALPEARRRAHLELAARHERDHDHDRRAWHLAAAATRPSAEIAEELERAAARAARQGAYHAAMTASKRAAHLHPEPGERARLLSLAAQRAIFCGRPEQVQELSAEAAELATDPAVRTELRFLGGWMMSMTTRLTPAFELLLDCCEAVVDTAPDLALRGLTTAANLAYLTGDAAQAGDVLRVLARTGDPDDEAAFFVRAGADPLHSRAALLPRLRRIHATADRDMRTLGMAGAAACYLDEPAVALPVLSEILARGRDAVMPSPGNSSDVIMAWVQFATGDWSQCADIVAEIAETAAESRAYVTLAHALAQRAQLAAVRGDADAARADAEEALRLVDFDAGSVQVRARWATGMAAAGQGDADTAYEQLRKAFDGQGAPVHFHQAYYVLADLAAAAVRTGHRDEAAAILDRAEADLGADMSARLRASLLRARALLSDDPDEYFVRALADPDGARWPFERALTHLDHGAWLRRRWQVGQARAHLGTALEVFERLGARPWADRARAELRAAGVTIAQPSTSAVDGLTSQQRLIARLAAQGLTNREIGERLFLSHRTVSTHLYRIFPQLGITARSQLRDAIQERHA